MYQDRSEYCPLKSILMISEGIGFVASISVRPNKWIWCILTFLKAIFCATQQTQQAHPTWPSCRPFAMSTPESQFGKNREPNCLQYILCTPCYFDLVLIVAMPDRRTCWLYMKLEGNNLQIDSMFVDGSK